MERGSAPRQLVGLPRPHEIGTPVGPRNTLIGFPNPATVKSFLHDLGPRFRAQFERDSSWIESLSEMPYSNIERQTSRVVQPRKRYKACAH